MKTTLRLLLWSAAVVALMFGAAWLAERPGTLTAQWHGWRLDTNVGVIAMAMVLQIGRASCRERV